LFSWVHLKWVKGISEFSIILADFDEISRRRGNFLRTFLHFEENFMFCPQKIFHDLQWRQNR